MKKFIDKLTKHYPSLPKAAKKVADVLLQDSAPLTTKSASEIGRIAGVSETTVIRFCYALDYSGYTELQKEAREHFYNQRSSLHEYEVSKKDLDETQPLYAAVMEKDRVHIERTIQQINENTFARAIERLNNAEKILVNGLRSSFSLAHWFSFSLGLIKGNTSLYQPGIDDVLLRVGELSKTSVLVTISFHRYTKESIMFAKAAKEQGAYIIGITDSPLAPISKYADLLFPVQLPVKSTLDAAPAVISLLNALVAGVYKSSEKDFQARRENYESDQLQDFFFS